MHRPMEPHCIQKERSTLKISHLKKIYIKCCRYLILSHEMDDPKSSNLFLAFHNIKLDSCIAKPQSSLLFVSWRAIQSEQILP